MKRIAFVVFLCFLMGCASSTLQDTKLLCRHKVLSVATAARQRYPVRIAVGEWRGTNHIQPQAKINGDWKYIEEAGNRLTVTHLDNFKVKGYVKLKEYFNILMEGQR